MTIYNRGDAPNMEYHFIFCLSWVQFYHKSNTIYVISKENKYGIGFCKYLNTTINKISINNYIAKMFIFTVLQYVLVIWNRVFHITSIINNTKK